MNPSETLLSRGSYSAFRLKIQTVLTGKSSKAWETACPDEESTRRLAADFVRRLEPGDIVLLEGPLGAGKTTFVRGALEGLGYLGIVRSPTFNLIQTFETVPPVLHADLYRVPSEAGLGIEEAAESCISFIECAHGGWRSDWPARDEW
jgi:tRNA threonylcarbamoyl adenosine modification protein YjeE